VPTRQRLSRRIGEILCSQGAIDRRQLDHALNQQETLALPLGRTLLHLHYITDEQLHEALASQFDIGCVDLEAMAVDRSLANLISRRYARHHALVPVAVTNGVLTVALEDPRAADVLDELTRFTGLPVTAVTAPGTAIARAWRRLYDGNEPVREAIGTQSTEEAGRDDHRATGVTLGRLDDPQGRRGDELFRQVLRLALDRDATDIHLEMLTSGLSLRLRVDGVLRRPDLGDLQDALDRHARQIVSRVKVLAALDIAERRRPQDGSFRVMLRRAAETCGVDLRVSVIPSHSGESVVIRLLDRSRAPRALNDLDLSPAVAGRLDAILKRTTGIFLVTGPTGSGKSTTLYSCLMRLHRPEIRILTAEDPVEYVYDGLSQSEVNPDIGNTFAHYLRAFLRHDPEVIMVGEIRDQETAEMAFRAAQTGHLLLSTLHTNTAVAAVPRLIDLGVDPSLLATSLVGVLSQRLVRRICSKCRQPATASGAPLEELFGEPMPELTVYRGAGCAACEFTGYKGRVVVADLWMPDDRDLMVVAARAPFDALRESAVRTTITMAEDAHARLKAGVTTLDELTRVLPYAAIVEHRARYGGRHRSAEAGPTRG